MFKAGWGLSAVASRPQEGLVPDLSKCSSLVGKEMGPGPLLGWAQKPYWGWGRAASKGDRRMQQRLGPKHSLFTTQPYTWSVLTDLLYLAMKIFLSSRVQLKSCLFPETSWPPWGTLPSLRWTPIMPTHGHSVEPRGVFQVGGPQTPGSNARWFNVELT